jgi:ABC transporter substrate binding protein (PQQ-dependent alcohol dehydrogenase system)
MIRWLVGAIGLGVVATHALAADPVEIGIGYLRQTGVPSKLSLVEQPAGNDGLAGALLAIEDNNTTGKFLNQHFTLEEVRVGEGDDVAKAATALAGRNSFIITDLPAEALLKAADALRDRGTVLLNAGSIDDRLREEDCRPNVIHVAPTRSMLADALAQYLVWKQWKRWILVVGSHESDKLYAAALRRAAKRFGAKIVQERTFEDTGGARRTDSGVTLIQRQMPVFTQQMPAYDVLVAADESEVFASYLPYRTWDPRPVAGSAGLVPTSWDAAHDQWGAIQMQNRFIELNSRRMTALDMQAWTAARMIGEATSRTNSGEPKPVTTPDGSFRKIVRGARVEIISIEPMFFGAIIYADCGPAGTLQPSTECTIWGRLRDGSLVMLGVLDIEKPINVWPRMLRQVEAFISSMAIGVR